MAASLITKISNHLVKKTGNSRAGQYFVQRLSIDILAGSAVEVQGRSRAEYPAALFSSTFPLGHSVSSLLAIS